MLGKWWGGVYDGGMMKIGIFANLEKPAAAQTLAALAEEARRQRQTLCVMDAATAKLLPGAKVMSAAHFIRNIDVLFSLGGDGTLIRAVHALKGMPVPLLGINLGHLGFLTSVPDVHAAAALRALVEKEYTISRHPMLSAALFRGRRKVRVGNDDAVNDIVVAWGDSPRVAHIDLTVNGEEVAAFSCDGMIVATPVGSTGHALSAGGPILHRDTPATVVIPICPHTLSSRPLVLPNDGVIALSLTGSQRELAISVDGRHAGTFKPGDRMEIVKSKRVLHFIQLADYSWFGQLSRKLHWKGSSIC